MKNKVMLLFVFVLFFAFNVNVKADTLKDKGYVVCSYGFHNSVKSSDGKINIGHTNCTYKIAVANKASKISSLTCEDDKLKNRTHSVIYDSESISEFHKSGTSDYMCPKLTFVVSKVSKTNLGGVTGPNGQVLEGTDSGASLTIRMFSDDRYEDNKKYYGGLSTTTGNSGSEVIKFDGAEVEGGCTWDVTALFKANSNPAIDDSNFIKCTGNVNTDLAPGITEDASRDIYKDDTNYSEITCARIFKNNNIKKRVKNGITLIGVVGVVILVLTLSTDFVKAISSGENDALAQAGKKAKNRIIATVILLMLPVFINFLIDVANNNLVIETKEGKTTLKIGTIKDCGMSK